MPCNEVTLLGIPTPYVVCAEAPANKVAAASIVDSNLNMVDDAMICVWVVSKQALIELCFADVLVMRKRERRCDAAVWVARAYNRIVGPGADAALMLLIGLGGSKASVDEIRSKCAELECVNERRTRCRPVMMMRSDARSRDAKRQLRRYQEGSDRDENDRYCCRGL